MNIGARIRARRIEIDMSQEELATHVGYKSRSSINKIEADGRGLPQDKIESIAEALRVSPSYLMGWEDELEEEPVQTFASKRHKVLYDRIKNATDEQLEKMEKIWDLVQEEEDKHGW